MFLGTSGRGVFALATAALWTRKKESARSYLLGLRDFARQLFSAYSPPAMGPRESGPGGKSEMQMLLGELRVAPAFSLPLSRAVVLEHLSAESARRMMGPWLVSDPGGLQWG